MMPSVNDHNDVAFATDYCIHINLILCCSSSSSSSSARAPLVPTRVAPTCVLKQQTKQPFRPLDGRTTGPHYVQLFPKNALFSGNIILQNFCIAILHFSTMRSFFATLQKMYSQQWLFPQKAETVHLDPIQSVGVLEKKILCLYASLFSCYYSLLKSWITHIAAACLSVLPTVIIEINRDPLEAQNMEHRKATLVSWNRQETCSSLFQLLG